jgi:toxin HigB-1
VIRSFANQATRDLFDGIASQAARRLCPMAIWPGARRRLDQLNQAEVLEDLRVPPNNRLKRLSGDRTGQHSIRINDQYRICFRWTEGGAEQVEVTDYH